MGGASCTDCFYIGAVADGATFDRPLVAVVLILVWLLLRTRAAAVEKGNRAE